MTAKEYLQQAFKADRKIKLDIEKLSAMKSALYGKSVDYSSDGSSSGTNENHTEIAIAKIIDYESQINAEIDGLIDKRLEIESSINQIKDETLREILTRRYLLYQKWELIAVKMNYNVQWIYKLHGRALSKIKIGY